MRQAEAAARQRAAEIARQRETQRDKSWWEDTLGTAGNGLR
jgi:hypothetical protein